MQSITYFLEEENITVAKIIMWIGHQEPPTHCHAVAVKV